jgi:hypothetical protein
MLNREDRQLIITASEVAEYVFCAKAWSLKRDGAVPDGRQLEQGAVFHDQHKAQIARSVFFYRAALFCALIAIILFVLLALFQLVM